MADHADQVDQHEFASPEAKKESEKEQGSSIKPDEELGDPSTFKTYPGHCHCGKFRFTITIPKINKLNECNCSICFVNGLRGLVWFPIEGKRKFEIVEGDEERDLTSYSFGRGHLEHKFCKECGTNLFARQGGLIGVNALALEPMPEVEAIPYSSTSDDEEGCETRDPQYATQHGEPVKWPTDEPVKEGEVEYQGHCHCGTVRYVLRHKPLKEWTVNDCNCSICFKSGINTTFVPHKGIYYPPGSREACHEYTIQQPSTPLLFCKVCGTHVCIKGPHETKVAVINARTIEDPDKSGKMLDHKKMKRTAKMKPWDQRDKEPLYKGRRHEVVETKA